MTRRFRCNALEQRGTRVERLALEACPGANAAVEHTTQEIPVAFLARRGRDDPFDPDLALERVPVQNRGDSRIGHVAFAAGELIGRWKRIAREGRVTAELTPMAKLTKTEREGVALVQARFEAFVN